MDIALSPNEEQGLRISHCHLMKSRACEHRIVT